MNKDDLKQYLIQIFNQENKNNEIDAIVQQIKEYEKYRDDKLRKISKLSNEVVSINDKISGLVGEIEEEIN